MRILGTILFFAFVLEGCATLNKDECLSADWNARGISDGERGRRLGYFQKYGEACLEHGVRPNKKDYVKGRNQGLKSYCTVDNSFSLGRDGKKLAGVCGNFNGALLRKNNKLGYEIYEVQKQINEINGEIADVEDKMDKTKSNRLRSSLRDEVRSLQRRQIRLEKELTKLEMTNKPTKM